jgi:hypothetical protein
MKDAQKAGPHILAFLAVFALALNGCAIDSPTSPRVLTRARLASPAASACMTQWLASQHLRLAASSDCCEDPPSGTEPRLDVFASAFVGDISADAMGRQRLMRARLS